MYVYTGLCHMDKANQGQSANPHLGLPGKMLFN